MRVAFLPLPWPVIHFSAREERPLSGVINLRKLAAIDILFLGSQFILAEFAAGVLLSTALGIFVLVRGHSFWQAVLGVYLVCLGINYVPMFACAVDITRKQSAREGDGTGIDR